MAERYEFVIDFSNAKAGEKFTLLNRAGDNEMAQVMQFVAAGPVVASSPGDYAAQLRREVAQWRAIIAKAGIVPE